MRQLFEGLSTLLVASLLLLPGAGLAQPIAAAPGSVRALPTATPTPLPKPPAQPAAVGAAPGAAGASMTAILNTPYHSPDRLDFDAVWDGQTSLKTFSFTTTAKGYIRAEIPPGPFTVIEIRELGPPKAGGSKNSLGPPQPMITQATIGKVSFPDGPGPWTYGADAGNQILVHVVFKPKFGSMTAGQKAATMRVSGPGPKGEWALSIPLNGMFDGKVVFTADEPTPIAVIQGTSSHDLPVSLSGAGVSVKGTIRGGSLPAGMSVSPLAVVLPGNQPLKAKVPLKLSWGDGGMAGDNQPRTAELFLDYPGGSEKLSFAVVGLPSTASAQTNGFQKCHATWYWAIVALNAKGTAFVQTFLKNDNIVNYSIGATLKSVNGVPVQPFSIQYGVPTNAGAITVPPFNQYELDYYVSFDPSQWRRIAQNPNALSFDCNASATAGPASPSKTVLK